MNNPNLPKQSNVPNRPSKKGRFEDYVARKLEFIENKHKHIVGLGLNYNITMGNERVIW